MVIYFCCLVINIDVFLLVDYFKLFLNFVCNYGWCEERNFNLSFGFVVIENRWKL